MVRKVADVADLVAKGKDEPRRALPAVRRLAGSRDWQAREVAATVLVEISKKQADAVIEAMLVWAEDADVNVRRAASEGLRHLARVSPERIVPVLDQLMADESQYVKKSVANVLRNASKRHPEFVLSLCRRWSRSGNPHTHWIIRDGLRKLKETDPQAVDKIVAELRGRRL